MVDYGCVSIRHLIDTSVAPNANVCIAARQTVYNVDSMLLSCVRAIPAGVCSVVRMSLH